MSWWGELGERFYHWRLGNGWVTHEEFWDGEPEYYERYVRDTGHDPLGEFEGVDAAYFEDEEETEGVEHGLDEASYLDGGDDEWDDEEEDEW